MRQTLPMFDIPLTAARLTQSARQLNPLQNGAIIRVFVVNTKYDHDSISPPRTTGSIGW